MSKKSKLPEDPTWIFCISIVAILIGFRGVERLYNVQGLIDILIGVALVITGFLGGILGFRHYRLFRQERQSRECD
ncbi:hypothetical protein DS745_03525 [Anaerobacillus alkaliphilus]|uniref:Uncharacterized protein n=1 Tax=Anaerobacillus alkaliphilus TaxID=1548597 RepID=A0A4Q0VXK1_9BACI|nr:hypothetical protein [Anaerobacillus alkaliphilus]RXJ04467.1 hypothetical protein DS745_03525 [Anaerobacillus alkaliphilus]